MNAKRSSKSWWILIFCWTSALWVQGQELSANLANLGARMRVLSPTAGASHLDGLAYGEGFLVAVGERGTLAVSEDAGETWRRVAIGLNLDDSLADVAYGAGRFLVAASGHGLLSASAGALDEWDLSGIPNVDRPQSIDFIEGQFIALDGNTGATSVDGLGWQPLTGLPEGTFTDVAFGAGVYVLVGSNGIIYTSPDLVTWTLQDSDTADWEKGDSLFGVRYAGDHFLATGFSGLFITSPDGVEWTRRDPPISRFLYDCVYFAGYYWLGNSGITLYRTTDFGEWERVIHGGHTTVNVFADAGDVIYGAGREGTLVRTTDGETWENIQGGMDGGFGEALFAKGKFIIATHDRIDVSVDGFEWETVYELTDGGSLIELMEVDGFLYGVASNGPILRSSDGNSWEVVGTTPHRVDSVTVHEGIWYLGGIRPFLMWGTDLTNWETLEVDTNEYVTGFAVGSGRVVALGSRGLIHTSPATGPVNWQVTTAVPNNSSRSTVAYFDDHFLAEGQGRAWQSDDGITWEEVEWFGPTNPSEVLKLGEEGYLSYGYLGTISTSVDGMDWDSQSTPSNLTIRDMVRGDDGMWVAVGNHGLIMTASPQAEWRVLLGQTGLGTVEANDDLSQPIPHGTEVSFNAVPAEGYILSYWDGLEEEDGHSGTLTVTENQVVRAVFIPTPYYDVVIEIDGDEASGQVERAPERASYPHGSDVTLTAVPAEGYEFVRWRGSSSSRDNPLTLTITRDQELSATFTPLPRYTINPSVIGEGTMTVSPDQDDYQKGDDITIEATPADGYAFVRWSGNVTGTENPLTFSILRNSTVRAHFEPATTTYVLEIGSAEGGEILADPAEGPYDAGTTVQLTPVPASGYRFLHWTGAAGGPSAPLSLTMDEDKSIAAVFVAEASFQGWALTQFPNETALPEGDPDGDGRSNLEEYALLTDPNDPGSVPSIVVMWDGGLQLRWQQRQGILVTPEVSSDLQTFAEAGVDVVAETVDDAAGTLTRTVRLQGSAALWRGMRLRLSLP